MGYNSLVIIQTDNLVSALTCIDTMVKTNNVSFMKKEVASNGEIILYFEGNAPHLENALNAGIISIHKVGKVISSSIITNPSDVIMSMISEEKKPALKRKTKRKKEKKTEKIQTLFDPVPEEDIAEEKFKVDKQVEKKIEIMTATSDDEIINIKVQKNVQEEETDAVKKEEPIEEVIIHEKETIPQTEKTVVKESEKIEEKGVEAINEQNVGNKNSNEINFSGLSHLERLRAEAKSEISEELQSTEEEILQETKEGKNETSIISSEKDDELSKMNVHQLRKLARSREDFPIKGREISKANRNTLLEYFRSL